MTNMPILQWLEYMKATYPYLVPPNLWNPQGQQFDMTAAANPNVGVYCAYVKESYAQGYVPNRGCKAVLFDEDKDVIYIKEADESGAVSTTTLDYTVRVQTDPLVEMQGQIAQLTQAVAAMLRHQQQQEMTMEGMQNAEQP